jgi:hypothetical protein
MIKTEKVNEYNIDSIIHREEKEGWEFVSATMTKPASSIGGADSYSYHSFPATFLLFFKKSSQ